MVNILCDFALLQTTNYDKRTILEYYIMRNNHKLQITTTTTTKTIKPTDITDNLNKTNNKNHKKLQAEYDPEKTAGMYGALHVFI